MRILVLGATGFIGINIVRQLVAEGHEVRVFYRTKSRLQFFPSSNLECYRGDLNELESLVQASQGCETVVHAAGYYPHNIFHRSQQIHTANTQMQHVLQAMSRNSIPRLIYLSSLATLGAPTSASELVDEETPYHPSDFPALYHRIKYEMEQQVLQAMQRGVSCVIFIPTAVFGPYDHKPATGRVILEILAGRLFFYLRAKLNCVHVRDVATLVARAIQRREITGRFIIGNWNTTLKDFLSMVARIAGVRGPLLPFPWLFAYPLAYISEWFSRISPRKRPPLLPVTGLDLLRYSSHVKCDKAKKIFSYTPAPISVAIKEAIDWYRDHGYV